MSTHTRKLSVIMFTDIVGYTELMGDDEEKGFSILQKNHSLQKPIIKHYNGQWLKDIGDGVLACFDTATDAVLCGKKIQDNCIKEPDLKLRIGIHLGEVLFKNNDVFGDGVNIASRIQEKAPPGGVYISESVFRNIQNKKGISAGFVKEERLKNVKFPVRIYEINLKKKDWQPMVVQKKSIAVLPFVNMSADPEQEYFCDGISEEIINTIVQFPEIKVSARTSSFSFKGKNDDLRIIGQKLGVSNVLEGSVRKSGNQVRITVQLLEAETGFHLWSKKYDRKLDDVFAIQDEIALEIADHLMATLSDKEEVPMTRRQTNDLEAYQLYFKGRSLYYQRGPTLKEGIECFRQALEIDPDYALAYSGLADSYVMLCLWGFISPEECWAQVIPASKKASQLDPDLSETCHTRAIIALFHDRDYQLAEEEFKKAIKLNPTNTQPRTWYGLFYQLYIRNNVKQGLEHCELITKYDPLSGYAHNCYALALIYADKFDEAEEETAIVSKLEPDSLFTHSVAGQLSMLKGNMEAAIKEYNICCKLSNNAPQFLSFLIYLYLKTGQPEQALKTFNQIEDIIKNNYIQPSYAAIGAAFLDKRDYAMNLIKVATEHFDPNFPTSIGVAKHIQTLTKLPGFKKVLQNAGIPIMKQYLIKNITTHD